MYLITFDEGTFGIGKQRQFNEALQVNVIMFRICVNSNFAPIVEETRLSQFEVRLHMVYWAGVFITKPMWPCCDFHAVWIISGPHKNLMKSEKNSSNEAPVKVQPGRGCLRSVIRLKHVRFLLSCTFSAKKKPFSVPEKIPKPCFQSMSLVNKPESVGQNLPAATEHLQWSRQKRERDAWSLCEEHLPGKKKEQFSREGDLFCIRQTFSCSRFPYWLTITFLLLLEPDWRGCCGSLENRGGDAKADVF